MRSLSIHSNVYYWILKKYGPNFKVTQQCFEDILESRIWIDIKSQENPEIDVLKNLTVQAFNSICSIHLEFCNEKIPFKGNYLSYLILAEHKEIIKPFFEISLPSLFDIELKPTLPYQINYEYNRPEVNNNKNNNKRKYNDMDGQPDMNEWTKLLEKLYSNLIHTDITEFFKNHLGEIN
jgi:hypothetical protein